jgi:tetratricopeptide (TPR) repeat protein
MADDGMSLGNPGRLARLLQYLESDPDTLNLLNDAAETAIAEGQPKVARDLLERSSRRAPLTGAQLGMSGLAAMHDNDFAASGQIYEKLLRASPSDPSIRFNLAWSWAMTKNFKGAVALLDQTTTTALPQAATLQVQLLHDQGQFEEAAEQANLHLARHPDHPGLLGAVSVLAMDNEDVDLARRCAEKAGDNPEALVTLGTLALGEQDARAFDMFSSALRKDSRAPRAWVGKGLAELASGDHAAAARDIQRGAELFSEHVGSWIAAGWAQLLMHDLAASRTSFEKALALDHNFAESHGSLAVLNILEGRNEEAQRQAETALRLDAKSFSGVLAHALLLQARGNTETARAIIERALHTPVDGRGLTIASAIARQGLAR